MIVGVAMNAQRSLLFRFRCPLRTTPGSTVDESNPFLEILLGTSILIVVIAVHGVGIRTINRRFNTFWAQVDSATSYWWINSILAIAIASLTVLHLMETLIWAIPISVGGLIPNMRNSYFYVLESYTTLGEGNVS